MSKKKYQYYWVLYDTSNDEFITRDQFFDHYHKKSWDWDSSDLYSRLATIDFIAENYSKEEAVSFFKTGYNSRFKIYRGTSVIME